MKISVSYDSDQIKKLIQRDIENKVRENIPFDKLDIQVRSKQNYRDQEWERGELKVELDVEI